MDVLVSPGRKTVEVNFYLFFYRDKGNCQFVMFKYHKTKYLKINIRSSARTTYL
nr:MAG TPA: hypothetical protein [Microviridae sp.]